MKLQVKNYALELNELSKIKSDFIFIFNLDDILESSDMTKEIVKDTILENTINELYGRYHEGRIPFLEYYMKKIFSLYDISEKSIIDKISSLIPKRLIAEFISQKDNVVLISDMPDVWIETLCSKLKVPYISSVFKKSFEDPYTIKRLSHIINTSDVVNKIKETTSKKIIYIGSNNHDFKAMQYCEYGIYFGDININNALLENASHYIFAEEELCRFLKLFV